MKLLHRLELADTQPLGSSRYNINKPHVVLITSIIAVILGLAVITAGIALLVISHALSSAIFNGILISIVLGVTLILCIGGGHSCIILQLARLHRSEVSGSENVIQELQTSSQDLQNCLSEEDHPLRSQQNQEIEDALQMQALLKSKQDELDSLTHRYAAMAQEHSYLENTVSRLRKELVELRRVLEENQATSQLVIEKLMSSNLRFYLIQQQSECQEQSALIFLKDQRIEELTNKVAELQEQISSLQLFLTDNERNQGCVRELNQKLITLKLKLKDLVLLITDSTKKDEITTPTGNSLIEFANALDAYASSIQEFTDSNIISHSENNKG
ncbi:IncA family protein [Chlamydia psittaci]|uniref:IncA family protein n=1 Tax=Chlamydia psittaci TaxID=83554 RepID=UPI00027E5CF1|nr:IncA family protein [Chlamydia psittaci]AFS28353.1 incA family protein [Chlamydia psittaci NJ1]KPZ36188.1 membrane protein [Chlamydia psittaci NJ1]MDS0919377.1 IncA family protein [Chlamydia psittaci]MDS0989408.1 IncA family protein [Chlamydia psittaci]MDS0995383.1 IncA family protein [Chlamydia psittaci]